MEEVVRVLDDGSREVEGPEDYRDVLDRARAACPAEAGTLLDVLQRSRPPAVDVTCGPCQGTGRVLWRSTLPRTPGALCPECGGSGEADEVDGRWRDRARAWLAVLSRSADALVAEPHRAGPPAAPQSPVVLLYRDGRRVDTSWARSAGWPERVLVAGAPFARVDDPETGAFLGAYSQESDEQGTSGAR